MKETTVVQANFISDFKIGDNIKYNLRILTRLNKVYENDPSALFIKPMILITGSIIEAILCDFNSRIKNNRLEGVHSLTQEIIDNVRGKQIDDFEKYIEQARKHDFFDVSQSNFYDSLHRLRKIRNRIHIQNKKHHKPFDEIEIFNNKTKISSEKLLEKTMLVMEQKHFRPKIKNYVGKFELPWKSYFPKSD